MRCFWPADAGKNVFYTVFFRYSSTCSVGGVEKALKKSAFTVFRYSLTWPGGRASKNIAVDGVFLPAIAGKVDFLQCF